MIDIIEESIKKLDERFASWDLYRTATKEWQVVVTSGDGRKQSVGDRYLGNAVLKAEEIKFLPSIPRRPKPVSADQFTVTKTGNQWVVSGPSGNWFVKTKKYALLTIEKAVDRNVWAISNWDEVYGWSASKTEGVDFVYSEY